MRRLLLDISAIYKLIGCGLNKSMSPFSDPLAGGEPLSSDSTSTMFCGLISIRAFLTVLPAQTGVDLAKAMPMSWLPFTSDYLLRQWRDFLAYQLHPGSSTKTIEVFAARQGIPPENYYRLLSSDGLMDDLIFSRISQSDLEAYRRQLLSENVTLLQRYLAF